MGRLPTGAKLFLILSAALLPLAIIAVYAASQSNQLADQEMRSRLRVAATESSRALAIELTGDMNALRVALDALDTAPDDRARCARVRGVFAEQLAAGARFAITDRSGRVRCGTDIPPSGSAANRAGRGLTGRIDPDHGLLMSLASPSGALTATAEFPRGFLAPLARPSGYMQPFAADLIDANARLPLATIPALDPLDGVESIDVPLGVAGLTLEMKVRSVPLTSAIILAMALPMLMWAAGTGIAWFVVDRLLIRPLRRLRRTVAAYRPGEEIEPGAMGTMTAQEIHELGDTFRAISQTVIAHEAGLAEGLVRQTKLTREVHHRVKNNLQVIASLINLHARAAHAPEAIQAYATIQRRVDALAVVHRNHYAELEENRGLSLRSVIGDLASNLRATLPDDAARASITLSVDSSYVNQDVATPVAFLITELIELALKVDGGAAVRIALAPDADPLRAQLSVTSLALADGEAIEQLLADRYGRVLEGLARQLRAPLIRDPAGAYAIGIAITGRD